MEQSYFWDANISSAGQEVHLYEKKGSLPRSQEPALTLSYASQMTPFHSLILFL